MNISEINFEKIVKKCNKDKPVISILQKFVPEQNTKECFKILYGLGIYSKRITVNNIININYYEPNDIPWWKNIFTDHSAVNSYNKSLYIESHFISEIIGIYCFVPPPLKYSSW